MNSAERIASAFHESYERQAEAHVYTTREASAVPWEDVPARNKGLMMAVVADLLERGVISNGVSVLRVMGMLPGPVTLATTEAVAAACGCVVYVGRRTDNGEAATGVVPCKAEHRPMMESFNAALTDSLKTPQDRPLGDVCAEIMAEVIA